MLLFLIETSPVLKDFSFIEKNINLFWMMEMVATSI